MNAQAANALYEAERRGVRQIRGRYYSGGGACALGAIALMLKMEPLALRAGVLSEEAMPCPLCGGNYEREGQVIAHLNDNHGLTFSEIARKLGPDHA